MNSLSKFLVDSILDDNLTFQSDTIPTVDMVISKELVENWVVHKFPKLLNEISNTTVGTSEVDDGPNFFFKNYKTFDTVSKIRAQKIGYEVLRQLTDEKFEDITVYREYPNGPVKAVTPFPAGVIGKVTATNQKDFDDERAYILWHRHVTRLMGLVGWTIVNDIQNDKEDKKFSVRFAHDLYTDETTEEPLSVSESKFFTNEELKSITDDIIGELDELMIGYEGEEDRRKREKRLKKLRKDLDKTTPTTEEKTPQSFDRLDFYLNYYKNVSPSTFTITKEDKDIRIQLEGSINEDVAILPTSLNIPRHKMPQVSSKNMSDYIQFLKSKGIRVGTKMVRVSDVKMTQKEVDKEKIRNLVQSDKREHLLKPVILSKDGYIIDGHHRVLALYNLDKDAKIKTIHVQLPVKELLRITFDYPKVFTKNINEATVGAGGITPDRLTRYYKALCQSEKIKPLPVKFGRVGYGGAVTIYNSKTMKPLYITFDLSRMSDPEYAVIHELTHQIKLETEGNAYNGEKDRSAKFKKLESKLVDKYMYSKFSELLWKPLKESLTEAQTKLKLNIPSDVRTIHSAFKKSGKKLYVVGGAVRDAILGKSPKDFDLATDAKPDEVIQIAQKNNLHFTEVGKAFGVVVVNDMEIATFRSDVGRGRRPDSVEYTDIYGDVLRRDLTINALFYDLDKNEIVDLVGGIADLKRNKIRTVGNAIDRFDEDPLRKLRAIRFAARLGGKLDKETLEAIVADPTLNGVSEERIRDEFIKSIQSAKSVKVYLGLMGTTKLLHQCFPNMIWKQSDFIEEKNPIIVLAYLFRRIQPQTLYKQLMKLKYTHDESNGVKFLVELNNFKPEDIFRLKKLQENTILTDTDIINWGKLIKKDLSKFVRFKLSVKGDDVMKLGFKGSEIGKEIQRMETQRYMNEDITIPVEVGDTILTGRFKNKKTTVKSIDTDEHGMPTINGRKVVTFRKLSDINEAEFILKPGFQFVAQKTIGDIKRGVKYVLKAVDGSIGKLVFTVKPASKNELIPVKSRSYSEFYSNIMGVNEKIVDKFK
jgi:tRNA nucleotidyltransferase/poly(A) polymerase